MATVPCVPRQMYVSALKLSLELALELRNRCDEQIHRDQVAEIDELLSLADAGRDTLSIVVDRLKIVETTFDHGWRGFLWETVRTWQRQTIEVCEREYRELELGASCETRCVVAELTMKSHEVCGRYFLRFDFRAPTA